MHLLDQLRGFLWKKFIYILYLYPMICKINSEQALRYNIQLMSIILGVHNSLEVCKNESY